MALPTHAVHVVFAAEPHKRNELGAVPPDGQHALGLQVHKALRFLELVLCVGSNIKPCKKGVTNMLYLRPGAGMLYLGSLSFDGVHGQDALWFKVFRDDTGNRGNWDNYSIPPDAFVAAFTAAFKATVGSV